MHHDVSSISQLSSTPTSVTGAPSVTQKDVHSDLTPSAPEFGTLLTLNQIYPDSLVLSSRHNTSNVFVEAGLPSPKIGLGLAGSKLGRFWGVKRDLLVRWRLTCKAVQCRRREKTRLSPITNSFMYFNSKSTLSAPVSRSLCEVTWNQTWNRQQECFTALGPLDLPCELRWQGGSNRVGTNRRMGEGEKR